MSSPFTVPSHGHSNGAGASSPKLAPRGEELQGTGDVSVRPMRCE